MPEVPKYKPGCARGDNVMKKEVKMPVVQRKAIDHYDRMIAWAKTQKPRTYPNINLMLSEIKEDWTYTSCSYCLKYPTPGCNECPLSREDASCCYGLWYEMISAKTWKTWIKRAEFVREYIRMNGGKRVKTPRNVK
jgi:hypothetical protein